MSRFLKDCFGSVISSLAKMRECVRCELLSECRAMNWREPAEEVTTDAGGRTPERDAPPVDPSEGRRGLGS